MLTILFTNTLLYLCLNPLIVESKIGLNLNSLVKYMNTKQVFS